MSKKIKLSIGVLAIIFLISGILGWQYFIKIKVKIPKIEILTPPQLEIVAYKDFSFSFSIENKKDSPKVENLNITIKGINGEINPNNIDLAPGKLQKFEVRVNKLGPGDYTVYLEINGKPNVNITKTIFIKSQIVVAFDQYHISEKFWTAPATYPDQSGLKFLSYLKENNIRTKIIESEFTEEILQDINVLIIAKPDQPLLDREKEALKKFLDQGGGLLLTGLSDYYMDSNEILNDLTKFLEINLRFNHDYLFPDKWTKEISEHQITSEIESIIYRGCSLSVKEPVITLVKQDGKAVYAIQQYSKGKVGAIGGYFMLRDDHLNICHQCQKLNLNLIQWLSTPESLD
jgi:hypothetical protein